MENKSKNTSEISQWIDNYLHISLDTEEYVEVRNFLILWNLFEAKCLSSTYKCNFFFFGRTIKAKIANFIHSE